MAKTSTRTKTIKGYYSLWEKVVPGEMDGQVVKGEELVGLFNYMRSIPISDRYYGDVTQRLIAFHGDAFTGDPDFIVPTETDDFIYGLFMKKRDTALPLRATQGSDNLEIRRIDIGESSFIFEVSYFIVNKKYGIILLLNNRNAGSLEDFKYYLQSFLAHDADSTKYQMKIGSKYASMLNSAYIPQDDVLAHLAKFARISTLNFKLAGEEGKSLRVPGFDSSDKALDAASKNVSIDDMDSLGGFSISVTISPQRGHSLDSSGIKKLYNNLRGRLSSSKYRKSFSVAGQDSEGRPDALDFISDNIMINTNVQFEGKYVPNTTVFEAMENDFLNKREQLVARAGSNA